MNEKAKIDPSTPHPEFEGLEANCDLCDDAMEGDVREYVPMLPDQTKDEWEDYVNRPPYFNVVGPTCTALIGAMTRKNFVLEGYEVMPQSDFSSGNVLVQSSLKELLIGARVAFLATVGSDGASKIVMYDADDIINWSESFYVIKQCELVRNLDNPFKLEPVESYLELYLDGEGVYQSRVWVETSSGWVATDQPTMLIQGKPIDFIPLFVSTTFDNSWEVYEPPLLTQSRLNISHFKQLCDLYHYHHWLALPTVVISGDLKQYAVTDDFGNSNSFSAPIRIGSTKQALHLESDAKASMLEVSGTSSSVLSSELAKTEERMYVAGSRLITSKRGVESAEALQIRSGSESAVLETIVTSLETALNQTLAVCGMIDRVQNPMIALNRDFTASVADPAMVQGLLQLYQSNVITLEQLTTKLINGEVIQSID